MKEYARPLGCIVSLYGLLLLAVAATACGSQYPDEIFGGQIQGKVFYSGEFHKQVDHPGLAVIAFALGVPFMEEDDAMPHAARITRNPTFGEEGVAYELSNLEPFRYYVTAAILNMDDIDTTPTTIAIPRLVEITGEEPATGVDLRLFDL